MKQINDSRAGAGEAELARSGPEVPTVLGVLESSQSHRAMQTAAVLIRICLHSAMRWSWPWGSQSDPASVGGQIRHAR